MVRLRPSNQMAEAILPYFFEPPFLSAGFAAGLAVSLPPFAMMPSISLAIGKWILAGFVAVIPPTLTKFNVRFPLSVPVCSEA